VTLEATGNNTAQIRNLHSQFANHLNGFAQRWEQQLQAKRSPDEVFKQINGEFQSFYIQQGLFHSANPKAEFLFKLKGQLGDAAASGAYAVLRSVLRHCGTPSDDPNISIDGS